MKPYFLRPVSSRFRVSGEYNEWGVHWNPKDPKRVDPVTGRPMGQHKGVDFGCPVGTPVLAPMDGVVSAAGYHAGSGTFVRVQCSGGYRYSLCHLSAVLVKADDQVRAGQAVARSGNSGANSTGAHLHITVWDPAGNPMDPGFVDSPWKDVDASDVAFRDLYLCRQAGVMLGRGDLFYPEAPLTRKDAARVQARTIRVVLKLLGKDEGEFYDAPGGS